MTYNARNMSLNLLSWYTTVIYQKVPRWFGYGSDIFLEVKCSLIYILAHLGDPNTTTGHESRRQRSITSTDYICSIDTIIIRRGIVEDNEVQARFCLVLDTPQLNVRLFPLHSLVLVERFQVLYLSRVVADCLKSVC